jgi:hypothetical protein
VDRHCIFLYKIDIRPNFVKKCEFYQMSTKFECFSFGQDLEKKTVLLLSPVTLRVVAVAVLMSFSGLSALSFSPLSYPTGGSYFETPLKKL